MSGPTRRERFRPLELVIGAGLLGVFTGAVVLLVTRQLSLAAIFTGIAFISALLVLAMLALAEGAGQDGDERPVLERHDPAGGEEPPKA